MSETEKKWYVLRAISGKENNVFLYLVFFTANGTYNVPLHVSSLSHNFNLQ